MTLEPEAAARVIPAEDRDVVHNLGNLTAEQVRAAFVASSALFLPTLVESYGLPYLEALALRRPILTSDRDFARWICGDLALYFDPLDAASIADAIERHANEPMPADYAERAAHRLRAFPADWGEVARRLEDVLREVVSVA